jgi:hypothetical protein
MPEPKPFRPLNTPKLCKVAPKKKHSGRSTPGAFGKSKFQTLLKARQQVEVRALFFEAVEICSLQVAQELREFGNVRPATRQRIDDSFGDGTTAEMIRQILPHIQKEAA